MNLTVISFISFVFGVLLSSLFFLLKKLKIEKEYFVLKSKFESVQSLKDIIKQDFSMLAAQTIKSEQEDMRRQNREALEEKIKPLTMQLSEFRERIEYYNTSGIENTTKILAQIGSLEKNNRIIEQEAKNLTEALTKNQNIKGEYGEHMLETVLQNSGMVEGIHYNKQYVSTSKNLKDGKEHIIRPDFVINLPENRHIIIDSKLTLASYLEYIKDKSKIKEFKIEVKNRILDLANKNYQNTSELFQPDFILMYVPIETSIDLIYQDAELIQLAYQSNIIIVSTSSLLTVIRLVNQLFIYKKQNENIQQIINAGTNLYETFVTFCNDLIELQKRFDGLSQCFTTTINRFKRNNKNAPSLFSQVQALKKMGVNTQKEIPDILINDIADDYGNEVTYDDENINC